MEIRLFIDGKQLLKEYSIVGLASLELTMVTLHKKEDDIPPETMDTTPVSSNSLAFNGTTASGSILADSTNWTDRYEITMKLGTEIFYNQSNDSYNPQEGNFGKLDRNYSTLQSWKTLPFYSAKRINRGHFLSPRSNC